MSSLTARSSCSDWEKIQSPQLCVNTSTVCVHVCVLSCFSCVPLFLILWTVAHEAPLSMGFSRQEYWIGSMPSFRGPSQSRDQPRISYACSIGRWVVSLLLVLPRNTFQYSCLKILWTEEPGGIQYQGLQRIGHKWVANTFYSLVLVYSHRIGLGGSEIWDWGSLVAQSV